MHLPPTPCNGCGSALIEAAGRMTLPPPWHAAGSGQHGPRGRYGRVDGEGTRALRASSSDFEQSKAVTLI